ncbi:MAG: polysaccharide deacetylase family protein [Bacteroidales bacterium]
MNKSFYHLAKLTSSIPLEFFIRISRQRLLLPFYHIISDKETVHIKHLYQVRTTSSFEKDIDFYLKHYSPITPDMLIQSLKAGEPTKKNSFLLTFDDGLREFHDVVAPILLRKGVSAICFLNSDFIDNKDLFYRYKTSILIEKLISQKNISKEIINWFETKNLVIDSTFSSLLTIKYAQSDQLNELAELVGVDFNQYLQTNKPYLDSNQINRLIKQGFSFGAHSIDHPRYSEISLVEQIRQTKESIDFVENKFNLDNRLFCFPFTDTGVKNNFFQLIFDIENSIADFTFGSSGLKKDRIKKNIQRIPMEIEDFSAQEIIYGEYIYYLCKSLLRKNTINRLW